MKQSHKTDIVVLADYYVPISGSRDSGYVFSNIEEESRSLHIKRRFLGGARPCTGDSSAEAVVELLNKYSWFLF